MCTMRKYLHGPRTGAGHSCTHPLLFLLGTLQHSRPRPNVRGNTTAVTSAENDSVNSVGRRRPLSLRPRDADRVSHVGNGQEMAGFEGHSRQKLWVWWHCDGNVRLSADFGKNQISE